MRPARSCGILLHPTSLPGPHGSGDLGPDAYRFIDWLAAAGQKLWQVLPLGGIGAGNSPYMSASAFAGNAWLIDLAELASQGWLAADELEPDPPFQARRVDFPRVIAYRTQHLRRAAAAFERRGTAVQRAAFDAFVETHRSWIDDYTLFMALSDAHPGLAWSAWPEALARRDAGALAEARREHAQSIAFHGFCQWTFDRQWKLLRARARERSVRIVGDTPIYVSYHSAEVWARQELFELDASGQPVAVAGVPPDYFSATGQRWGNPLYRWDAHAAEGYAWWIERVRRTLELVDVLRIDHFRGFAGFWAIPAGEPTAVNGCWQPGPGAPLFDAIGAALGNPPVIAEDLGTITPDVDALRKRFAFPGMRVLQFAFGDDATNRYLPHNHDHDSVVYPGTHDNDTCAGWWSAAPDNERDFARHYFATDGHQMPWTLIRAALSSVADTAVVALQDVLALGSEARMNFPSRESGCWEWRFEWDQLQPWHGERLALMTRLYGR